MKKFAIVFGAATMAAFAAPTAALADNHDEAMVPVMVEVKRGDMLYSGDGKRISNVYRVTEEGHAQIIYRGKMVTIANDSLSQSEGKLTTTLTRADIRDLG